MDEIKMTSENCAWRSVDVFSGMRIVRSLASIHVVIDVCVVECHARMDVVIGVRIVLCGLFALTFSFYLLLFLSTLFLLLFLFLTDKKFMANLYNSVKEGVDTNDVRSFTTNTKRTKAGDKRLNRLISYIHHTCEYK